MRPYYRSCPGCGANLDPGELCPDCVGPVTLAGHKNAVFGQHPKDGEEKDSCSRKTSLALIIARAPEEDKGVSA